MIIFNHQQKKESKMRTVKAASVPWKIRKGGDPRAPKVCIYGDDETLVAMTGLWEITEAHANAEAIIKAMNGRNELIKALETIHSQCGPFAQRQPALDYAGLGNVARDALRNARDI